MRRVTTIAGVCWRESETPIIAHSFFYDYDVSAIIVPDYYTVYRTKCINTINK